MPRALIASAAAAALLLPLQLGAQEWSFRVYPADGTPWEQSTTFRLTEVAPGQHRARIALGGTTDECIRRELRASVQEQGAERIVVLQPAMAGCPERRMVIKMDGSGGRVEVKQGDGSWQWDGRERGLTRK